MTTLLLEQGVSGCRPGAESTLEVVDIGVAGFHEIPGGGIAHASAAAVDDYLGVVGLRELSEMGFDLVEGNERVRLFNLPLLRDVHVHKKEVHRSQHPCQLFE